VTSHTIYYYQDFMDPDFPFKLEHITEPTLNRTPHAHEHFQICYLQQGACLHCVDNQSYLMIKGDMLAVPPFVPHRFESYQGAKVSMVQVDFMPIVLDSDEMMQMPPFFPKIRLSGDCQAMVEQLLASMHVEHAKQDSGYRHLIRADLIRLLVTIFRQSGNGGASTDSRGGIVLDSRRLFVTWAHITRII